MNQTPTLTIRQALPTDLDAIMAIEEASYRTPWSRAAMAEELGRAHGALYLAAETAGQLVAFAGMWCFAGEAHIMNVAVAHGSRRQGLGEALLLLLLQRGAEMGADFSYLECRPSNRAAIALYEKLGFHAYARRPSYYRDTGEDAWLMGREHLTQMDFEAYWRVWERKHGTRPTVE